MTDTDNILDSHIRDINEKILIQEEVLRRATRLDFSTTNVKHEEELLTAYHDFLRRLKAIKIELQHHQEDAGTLDVTVSVDYDRLKQVLSLKSELLTKIECQRFALQNLQEDEDSSDEDMEYATKRLAKLEYDLYELRREEGEIRGLS